MEKAESPPLIVKVKSLNRTSVMMALGATLHLKPFFTSEAVILAFAGMTMNPMSVPVFGVLGSTVGGVLCFYIARFGGRPLAEKFVNKGNISSMDGSRDGFMGNNTRKACPFHSL